MHDGVVATRSACQTIIDHLPMPVFLMDADARIQMHNSACRPLLPPSPETIYKRRFGEALHCIHSAEGCGLGPQCPACPVRDAVGASARGIKAVRSICEVTVVRGDLPRAVFLLVTVSPMRLAGKMLNVVVLEDVTELQELRKLIPICASCKKIRSEAGEWEQIESYLHKNSTAALTHGLCPECAEALMREVAEASPPREEDQT
jgi:hypothetical protein